MSGLLVDKIRPIAEVRFNTGIDGWDGHYYIRYKCPTCGREISTYSGSTACDRCGTFYDWGNREPKIKVSRTVEW